MEDNSKKAIIANIHKILEPWVMKGETQNYFRVRSVYNNKLSMGILISGAPKDGKDKILFERSLETGRPESFKTINEKPLEELDIKELEELQSNVSAYTESKKVFPAVIRDYYSDEISSEIDWFIGVDFKRPVDGEMANLSDDLEAVDKQEAVFNDFDGAIYYAEKASVALERRGHRWDEMTDDGHRVFHVTIESDDPRIIETAEKCNGKAEVSHKADIPLTMTTFNVGRDARNFHDDVHRLLKTEYYMTIPWAKIDELLKNDHLKPGEKIYLGTPKNLQYRDTAYTDDRIRNVRTASINAEGKLVVSNGSRSVPVDDLLSTSAKIVHKGMDEYQMAKDAVYRRVTGPDRNLTESHKSVIEPFVANLKNEEKQEVFDNILKSLEKRFTAERIPQQWIDSAKEELHDLAQGKEQSNNRGLRR